MAEDRSEKVALLIYRLQDRIFAIGVALVHRVIQVVEITPIIDVPRFILGLINLEGNMLPVLDIRRKFGMDSREIRLSDRLIIAQSKKRLIALMVDEVTGVETIPRDQWTAGEQILDDLQPLQGTVRLENNIVCIYDIDKFIAPQDQLKIDRAMENNS